MVHSGRMVAALLLFAGWSWQAVAADAADTPQICSYESFNWNVRLHRAVNIQLISHPYAELQPEEVDAATGCTVCMEDQQLLQVGDLPPFHVCRKLAAGIKLRLEQLLAEGQPVIEVVAYRPGRTRNPLDNAGNRTGFSNHAYGAAIDINRSYNGLYDRCTRFGPTCRLLQGGHWLPGRPGTLMLDSPIVAGMKEEGFRWGGEIEGDQKDFMHFSLTGY
jgi:D-alanyl-D-alanine carboxypeptidase